VDDDLVLTLGGEPAGYVLSGGEGGKEGYWPRVWGARGLLHAWDDAATDAIIHATTDEAWRVREIAAKVIARTASAPRSPRSPSFAPTRSRECKRRLNARLSSSPPRTPDRRYYAGDNRRIPAPMPIRLNRHRERQVP
jgi:hypothetical protein